LGNHLVTNSLIDDNTGGDDVQQLCEAGEEEFLEIMALVGMASKPLHVRRLQKALQEWVSNPGLSIEILHLLTITLSKEFLNCLFRSMFVKLSVRLTDILLSTFSP
jgi:hypothetical protein